jgi:DNA-binding NtrC family response regulator
MEEEMLEGKRVLLVDDEPDVLDNLEELLPMCDVAKAVNFDKAKELLETQAFDFAILDIMGVDGYRLLEIAKEKNVIPVMLTANALSIEDTIKSFKQGAASYLPKEKMSDIVTFLNDILEAKKKGKSFWWRWLGRMESYYDRKFGSHWKEKDKEFWRKLDYYA